ncbi:MAG: hypothetical protein IJK87_08375 [Prevotella sp.]|nr:hypothetical protein [Prevotella sp.]
MTNIEAIKEDYKIGDPIRITCRLGIKEGTILEILDSRIKIRPFEEGRKPISISEDSIMDFEEAIRPLDVRTEQNDETMQKAGNTLKEDGLKNSTVIEVQVRKNAPAYEKGYVDLTRIDSKAGKREAVHVNEKKNQALNEKPIEPISRKETKQNKNNPFFMALGPQPLATTRETLKTLVRAYSGDEDNSNMVKAVGFVMSVKERHGWIWDQNLHDSVYFSLFDICDDDLSKTDNLLGIHVVYTKTLANVRTAKGSKDLRSKAVGICLPGPISELLAMADLLSDNERTYQKAFDILEDILEQYPDNDDAKEMSVRLSAKIKPRIKHSFGDCLNLDDVRSLYKNRSVYKAIPVHEEVPTTAILQVTPSNAPRKPLIITDKATIEALPLNKNKLTESECREIEKELDGLIRNGEREQCLKRSYEVLAISCPTPKYLRSYLDRMVNTEIALGNNEAAMNCLAQLIAYNEKLEDTKPNTLSHLYITLARIMNKIMLFDEALQALDCAKWLKPENLAIENLRNQINSAKNSQISSETTSSFLIDSVYEMTSSKIVVSKMLQQDVEEHANNSEFSEGQDFDRLYDRAHGSSKDNTKTFESRAQLFLDAAAAFYRANKDGSIQYKHCVAHYARMKGNSLVSKITESVQQYPDSRARLIAECDSAKSYYLEALGLYNDLNLKRYLQELLLKYLKIESLASQVDGGKTPDSDWYKGTLKAKLKECLNDDNVESQKVLFRACIAIGSTVERAWNTLANDQDGTGPFYDKLRDIRFRDNAYEIINTMEKSSVDITYAPGEFLRKTFENRQIRIKELKSRLDDCLAWDFSPRDIVSYETKWELVSEFRDLMSKTDNLAFDSIQEIINILRPYAGRKENERYRNLVSSQQILIKSQKLVSDTTTYYGRIFFYHLQEKWLREIGRQIEERDARTLPILQISPEPCYIKISEEGQGVIDFVVTNIGDSTAQSFNVIASINGKDYSITHNQELAAGDCCGEKFISADFSNWEAVDVVFKLTAQYQGRDLTPIESEATYEIESEDVLLDDIQIPWKISDTPKENIFKGREEKLSTLINHYLSIDRTQTYILYGLTRTGKSSILDYLCERIDGKPLHEDSTKTIKTFRWDFSKISFKNSTVTELWTNLIEINIYNKLPEDIQDCIDQRYANNQLPELLRQSDLDIIIATLNSKGIIPLITIDEFSNIRPMLKEGLVDATFMSDLRDLALKSKACFVYAGTYDIKELPKEKEFGIEGQMTNTRPMHINEIAQIYADELIDACDALIFDEKAKAYIRALSGCVPYWIQWICLDCGKYAVAHKKRHLGYNEVDYVIRILTGETHPKQSDTWEAIDETNFHNNQISPDNVAEHQLISSISYLIRESTQIERGVSMDELVRLWDKYKLPDDKRLNMTRALKSLEEKRVLRQFTDETREVYRLNVDLFRRWWFVHHRDLSLEFSL